MWKSWLLFLKIIGIALDKPWASLAMTSCRVTESRCLKRVNLMLCEWFAIDQLGLRCDWSWLEWKDMKMIPDANHGAGIFTGSLLGDFEWVNVGNHILYMEHMGLYNPPKSCLHLGTMVGYTGIPLFQTQILMFHRSGDWVYPSVYRMRLQEPPILHASEKSVSH